MAKSKRRRKPIKRKRPRVDVEASTDLGLGLVLRGDPSKRWSLEATDFAKLREALGDDLLCHFGRAFVLTNHLATAYDLITMNYRAAEHDSPRQNRNLQTLAFIVAGHVRELSRVLTELRRADVANFLSAPGKERWDALLRFENLAEHKTIKTIRDEMSFHAGTPSMIRSGIESLARQEGVVVSVMAGDGTLSTNVNATLGAELAHEGTKVVKTMKAAMTEVRDAHMMTLAFIKEIFMDVLRTKGAELRPLPPLTARQRELLRLSPEVTTTPQPTTSDESAPAPATAADHGAAAPDAVAP